MTFIRTVLGDIDPRTSGRPTPTSTSSSTAAGSSSQRGLPPRRPRQGRRRAREPRRRPPAIVDALPCAAGRNVVKLAEASAGAVHVIASTGLHLSQFPGRRLDGARLGRGLAARFEADVVEGSTARLPRRIRRAHRAPRGRHQDRRQRRADRPRAARVEAAAAAHARTGCPILTLHRRAWALDRCACSPSTASTGPRDAVAHRQGGRPRLPSRDPREWRVGRVRPGFRWKPGSTTGR